MKKKESWCLVLAKTQNLFNNEDEFIPVEFKSTAKDSKPEPAFTPEKPEFFVLSSKIWQTIQSDKDFAAEIEKVITSEVERRLSKLAAVRLSECEVVIAQRQVQMEQEGFDAGLKRAEVELEKAKSELRAEVDCVKSGLKQQIENLVLEKQRILNEHQGVWLQAFSSLLKKFLVKNAGRIEAGLTTWLETQVSNFSSTEKLKVFIPESEFKKWELWGVAELATQYEISKDNKLKEGEFRIESKSGGLFFSSQHEMEKLDDLLAELGCLEELKSA